MTGQGRPPIRETATTAALRQAGTPLRTLASGLANARARRRTDSLLSGARSSAFAALGVVATAALFFALLPGLSPPLFPIAVAQDSSERTDAVESRGKSFLGRLGGPLRGPLAQRESSREQIREPSREPNRDQGGASGPPPFPRQPARQFRYTGRHLARSAAGSTREHSARFPAGARTGSEHRRAAVGVASAADLGRRGRA